ncbi:MAG TPA: tetratricopeptide repeat protein [Puia sp.]|nr:tetratricopeptide repeat protein [Puia sp.]
MNGRSESELIKIGTGLLDTFKYKKAIDYFSEAIQLNPANVEAFVLRGIANFKVLNISDSLDDISKAIDLDGENHLAWFNKGEIFWYKGELQGAEICYQKSNELSPGNLFYLTGLIQVNLKQKKPDMVIQYCNQILKDYPVDSFALKYRASAYIRQLNYQAAIEDYLKLIDAGKKGETLYNSLGFCYSKIGQFKKAFNNLSIALQMNPTHPYALNNMGYVKFAEGQYRKAIELIEKSLEIDPSNAYAYKNRALVFIKLGEKELALADLKAARSLGYQEEYGSEVDELILQLTQAQ